MQNTIDFTNCEINKYKNYGGKNGNKLCVLYHGKEYMLKFPPKPKSNPIISYTNSCFSEYVACQIYTTLGIDTQETLLGTYKDKVVVACKDFVEEGFTFQEFAFLKNSIVDSEYNGYGTELSEILSTFCAQQLLPENEIKERFWDMFITDALLGNFDRHNGNWGFLTDGRAGIAKLAPVFDCDSCLYPQLNDEGMKNILSSRKEIEQRIFVFPNSAIYQNGAKINYAKFIIETHNNDCLMALERIGDRINLAMCNRIIENTLFISDTHKEFLKIMIKERKEKIIDKSIEGMEHISQV